MQWEWLIAVDCGAEASLAHNSLEHNWQHLSHHDNWFVCVNSWWYLWEKYLVSAWCQQFATIDLIREMFGYRFISRNCNVNWLPKSCVLTRLKISVIWSVKRQLTIWPCGLLWAQAQQRFEWNNNPFVHETIVLQNKRKKVAFLRVYFL